MFDNFIAGLTTAFTEFFQSETFTGYMTSLAAKLETIDLQNFIDALVKFVSTIVLGE